MYIKRRILSLLIISLFLISFNSVIISSEHIKQNNLLGSANQEFSIDLTFNPSDLEYETVDTELGVFTSIKLPGEGFNYIQGTPKLPTIRRLVEIPIGANPIISVTDISWDHTSLEELNLWGNRLTSLPKTIINLSNLKTLDLSFNRFEQLPSFLNEFERKTSLNIKI